MAMERFLPEERPEQVEQLREEGYTVLYGYTEGRRLEALRDRTNELFELEGEKCGWEFKQEAGSRRLANLVDKGELYVGAAGDPVILEWVKVVLGGEIKLSSLNARCAEPMNGYAQPLHCDMGAVPDEQGNWVCNTIWMLDDFTESNGATRIVPRTHLSGKLPGEVISDPAGCHPDEHLLTAPAGSVAIINAHVWHGGTENRTRYPRNALHGFYVRRDKPQQQYQKKLLRQSTLDSLSPHSRHILALDDALNDELSANPGRVSGFMK